MRDLTAKSIPSRKKELLRCGVQDVAFGDDAEHVVVQVHPCVWEECGWCCGAGVALLCRAVGSQPGRGAPARASRLRPLPATHARPPPVQTKGMVGAAGLMMLDFRPKEPAEEWHVEGIHSKLPGLCLASASTSKGGYGVVASSSAKTDIRVYSTAGRLLGQMDTGGLNNYMCDEAWGCI